MRTILLALVLLLGACTSVPPECAGQPDEGICLAALAAEQQDPGLCDATDSAGLRAFCLNSVALAMDSLEPCLLIEDGRSVEYCQRDVYIAQNNSLGCDTLTIPAAADSCYDSFARSALDWKLCVPITADGKLRDPCLDFTSRNGADPEGCYEISGTILRDQCLLRSAKKALLPDYCLGIVDRSNRVLCVASIGYDFEGNTTCLILKPEEDANLCNALIKDARKRAET